MIVIGGHEPSRVRRLLGHRVDDTVAHGAHCDVLIVH
jgi:nucleotide-binding universal stress UspA family protein